MFFNNTNIITPPELKSFNSISNLDVYLENEKNNNVNEPWSKLNKTLKIQKLHDYIELYKQKHDLNEEETILLFTFLKDCIDRKKLQRVKDLIYDKKTGIIKDIPVLCYVKSTKHFTLKNIDKRISTLKSLKTKTIQIIYNDNDNDNDEN